MPKFRVVLKIPGTIYAYHDIEAKNLEALDTRLNDQEQINQIVADGEGHSQDVSEVDEAAAWIVDEIGTAR